MVYDADMAEALRDFADELSVVGSEFRVLIAIDALEVEDGFQAEFDRLVLTSSAALLDKAHALDRDRIAVAATVEENRAWMEDGKRYGAVGAWYKKRDCMLVVAVIEVEVLVDETILAFEEILVRYGLEEPAPDVGSKARKLDAKVGN